MKTVVAHIGPDLDAITSIWLTKTFLPGWEEAGLAFVPAGQSLKGMPPDSDPQIMHVDTGFGRFDHHQTDEDICASTLVYAEIKLTRGSDKALERMVAVVNDIDHFREVFLPNPTADIWEFSLIALIDGWRLLWPDDPLKVVALGMDALDAVYKTFQNKLWAERELESGREFQTKWGKAMALETINDEVVHLGQKMGFMVMVRKDPKRGYIRIKAYPKPEIDLTATYERYRVLDPNATWFLHASKHMILNGSSKNPAMKPTTLTLEQIIAVLQEGQ